MFNMNGVAALNFNVLFLLSTFIHIPIENWSFVLVLNQVGKI